jgi:hypothetical protein
LRTLVASTARQESGLPDGAFPLYDADCGLIAWTPKVCRNVVV